MAHRRRLTAPPSTPAPPSSESQITTRRIGGYQVVQLLGSGATGTVFLARSETLERDVALKLSHGVTPDDLSRYRREARALARVGHVNLPAIFDRGHHQDGRPFLVIEHLRGPNLHQLVLHDGPQPVSRVVHLLQQLAGALWAVHARGLVHRDIKPSNVMVTRQEGTNDVVKLIDFGLAFDALEDLGGTPGGPCGTPGYVAPETFEEGAVPDGRADLFALGAVGHFLLVGQHADESDVLRMERGRDRRCAVTRNLWAVLQRCAHPDPEARPRDARALFFELRELSQSAPWHPDLAEHWWSGYADEWHGRDSDVTLVEPPRSWVWA